VNFVGLEGDEKDKIVVIGDGVDAVKLTNCLRKKVGQTEIVSLGEVKASWKTERKQESKMYFLFVFSNFSSSFWCSCQI